MLNERLSLTLIGKVSAWRVRGVAHLQRSSVVSSEAAMREATVLAAWLHHRSCGMVGVYTFAHTASRDALLRRGQWVQIQGSIQPCLAYALPDDPRSIVAIACTPLLLAVTTVAPVDVRKGVQHIPLLQTPQQARILAARSAGKGTIASVVNWPDAVYWSKRGDLPAIFASWNTVRGVVTPLGDYRYIRYVLSLYAQDQEGGRV